MTSRNHVRLELLNVHYFISPRQRVTSKRTNDPSAELVVMLSGVYTARELVDDRQKVTVARAGDIVYWKTNEPRVEENDPEQPTQCISIYFRGEDEVLRLPRQVHDKDHFIRIIADKMLAIKDEWVPLPRWVLNSYLSAVVAEVMRLSTATASDLPATVARFVEEHLTERFTIDDLAARVGLNKHHFGRKYRAITGRTPMQDVRRIRAEHARMMIYTNPRLTLKEIAPRVGINDEHQLSRLMKKSLGVPVRELRK